MEIGGIGSGGLDYQDLLKIREAMAAGESSSHSGGSRSSNSSVAGIEAGSASSTSQNSSSNKDKQQSTSRPVSNQAQVGNDPINGFKDNAHRFAIDQAMRQTSTLTLNTFISSLNTNEANDIKTTVSFAARNPADILSNLELATPLMLSSDRSLATSSASAITAKYSTQSQVPVLNTFKPVDKYV